MKWIDFLFSVSALRNSFSDWTKRILHIPKKYVDRGSAENRLDQRLLASFDRLENFEGFRTLLQIVLSDPSLLQNL